MRETWAVGNIYDKTAPRDINPGGKPGWCGIRYAANQAPVGIKDRPSIHMPCWASRLTLMVEGVRVERLQDISEADAVAEGCPGFNCPPDHNDDTSPQEEFRELWDSLNSKRAPWDSNPWVVAVTFRAVMANIDKLEATP